MQDYAELIVKKCCLACNSLIDDKEASFLTHDEAKAILREWAKDEKKDRCFRAFCNTILNLTSFERQEYIRLLEQANAKYKKKLEFIDSAKAKKEERDRNKDLLDIIGRQRKEIEYLSNRLQIAMNMLEKKE